jgi:predicted DsbA family dithiol-disulfide isomerase
MRPVKGFLTARKKRNITSYRIFMEKEQIRQDDLGTSGSDVAEETLSDGKKTVQNLASAAILLAGLFVGSLFVDIAQLLSGQGFSPRALKEASVVEAVGKTWVAYSEPRVSVRVITDSACGDACDPSQALVWMRRILPTLTAVQVDYNEAEGKALAEKAGVNSLPAFVFSSEIDRTEFFSQAQTLFARQDDGHYVLDAVRLGVPAGKFLSLPEVSDRDIQAGPKDAKVKIVEFSDFQCPYCKAFHPVLKQALDEYEDRILFSYKHLPLSFHPQANNAALASECANEQGKFFEYGDMLFARQDEWSKSEGTSKFKEYASRIGLRASQFNQCLDDRKYQDKVDADTAEAQKFGVSGTPGTFVNGQFIGGLTTAEEVKRIVDEELAK